LAEFWKKRYFVLIGEPTNGLAWFKYDPFERLIKRKIKARGFISFAYVEAIEVREKSYRFSLVSKERKFHFRCKTDEERQTWIKKIEQVGGLWTLEEHKEKLELKAKEEKEKSSFTPVPLEEVVVEKENPIPTEKKSPSPTPAKPVENTALSDNNNERLPILSFSQEEIHSPQTF